MSALDLEFTEFVAEHRGTLQHAAFLMTGDEAAADDLVQDALVKAYLVWHRIDTLTAWAYVRRIMANLVIDRWRRRRYEVTPRAPVTRPDARASAEFDRIDARAELIERLRSLSPRERAVVYLRHYADLSEAQVADELGIAVGTVKSTCSRALARLRIEPANPAEPTMSQESAS